MRCKTVCFANQKGGVGKTTTCVNLSGSISWAKRKVLLIDLDPQGNATMGSGIDKNQVSPTVNELLLGEASMEQVLIINTPGGYDLLPGNSDLTCAEVGLLQHPDREKSLSKLLAAVKSNYEFIFIDCPPALNMLTLNALVAADSVIIPMQCEYFALEGLSALISTMKQITDTLNPRLKIEGIVRTMFDSRNKLSIDVSEQLLEHFSDKVYSTVIPRNIRLAEAPSHGLPAILYDKGSRGSSAYLNLAGEFLRQQVVADKQLS